MDIKALIAKEFKSFFYTPIGSIFMVVFLVVANFLFLNNFFLYNNASLRSYFTYLGLMIVFLTPALTMRSFAEERKQGTHEILLTLPIKEWQIVLGKFLANLVFLAIVLIFTLTVPVSVSLIGRLDWGPVVTGYIGILLFGAFSLSIGLYVSSLTNQQISSFLVSLLINFVLFLIGQEFILDRVPLGLVTIVRFISPSVHTDNFNKGVIDIRDLIYFISFIFVFLLTLMKNLTRRRYK